MRFNKHPIFLAVVCLVWLSGCAAPAPRQGEAQPAEISEDTTSTGSVGTNPDVQRQYRRALAAMKAKQDKQAERLLVAMAQTYHGLAGPYVNLGIIYYRTGRPREAEQAFKKAIGVNPNRPDIYNHLGILLREEGRFREAREAYGNALKLAPDYAYAHLNLGILYDLYLLDANRALFHYQRYQALTPAHDQQVSKWIVDLKRRIRPAQKTAVR